MAVPMSTQQFIHDLTVRFGDVRLLRAAGPLSTFESDALTAFSVKPAAVLIANDAQEVIDAVAICHKHAVPFVARGSGTSLSGGSLPIDGGLVIGLNRLNRILKLDPRQRIAVVEPGTINLAISKAAEPHGLYYAPDPSSQQICTIGGNVAFNSGGAHCLKYGMTSNHVLGIKALLTDGQVVDLGGQSLDSIGPDTTGFYCGSEGLFGVALQITVRLLPRPERYHTVMAGYATLEQAGDAVSAIIASGLLPGALEIMDRLAIKAAEAAVSAHYPPGAEAILIVELEGPVDQVEAERVRLQTIIDQTGPVEVSVARDAAQRLAIWKGRKCAFSAVGRLSPDFLVQDGVVPRSKLGYTLRQIQLLSQEMGLSVANVFHAGDGNLHPLILFDSRIPGQLHTAEELAGRILKLCVKLGGSITGEHGVGMEKRQYMPEMFSEIDLDTMRKLRLALDPREISNRGKMFPGGEAPSLTLHGLHPLEQQGVISRV